MTLLSVVRDVCAVVGVNRPSTVISNLAADRTMQEMLALANEIAQRIAYDTRDWTLLRKPQTYTGDGVTTAFDLPVDYKRMLLTSNVWLSTSTQQPMTFIADTDAWLRRRLNNANEATWGEWTMLNGQMHIYPVMAAATAIPAVSAAFAYVHKNCIKLFSGGIGSEFVNDGDSFALDERLLKLGMIWQWKANKGTSYAEDMGTYGDALAVAMGHDSPAPILMGRPTTWEPHHARLW